MARLLMTLASLALLTTSAIGCVRTSEETVTEFSVVCADPHPDGALVRVLFHECLSGSCDEELSSSCQATLEGSTVTVTAEAVIEHKKRLSCTLDCQSIRTECVAVLPPGTYDIVGDGSSLEIEVPLAEPACPP